MKIGFDASMLVYQGSGVATYTYQLIRHLLLIDKKKEYHLFYSSLRRPKNFYYLTELQKSGAYIHSYLFPPRILTLWWNKLHIFPVEWFIGKVDIFHSSDFLRPPLLQGTIGVTTIHDLTWKIYPQFHTSNIISAHHKKLTKTVRHHDAIITDSPQTKKDLIKYYPSLKKNPITTIALGVEDKFFVRYSKKNIQLILDRYRIQQPYLLYVGAIEPRKNLIILIEAFRNVLKQYPKLQLVLVGRAGWKNKKVFSTIQKLKLNDKVLFTGFVADEDLPLVYQGAQLFVYPSAYEGFGLPPLESLAGKTPIIAYNSPSIPGSFRKTITATILGKDIIGMLNKPSLPKIKILRWHEVAQQTLAFYQKIIRQ